MTTTRRGTLVLGMLMVASMLPLPAMAQDDDTTTTTVEIEISATSITSTTEAAEEDAAAASGSGGPDDTLPFTGSSSHEMAKVAYLALGAGAVLLAVTRRKPTEGTKND